MLGAIIAPAEMAPMETTFSTHFLRFAYRAGKDGTTSCYPIAGIVPGIGHRWADSEGSIEH
jgi:hypothetical protein